VLGPDRVLTRPPGHTLRVEPSELDLARVESLLAEAERSSPAAAGRRLRDALALWRGPPLADLACELEALVAAHPLRERLHRHLMLALYRSGRQAEALAAFRRLRAGLVDELGIEPGREVRELERAILAQDAALDLLEADDRPPRRHDAGTAFVGRERELGSLVAALQAPSPAAVASRSSRASRGSARAA
jgi:hypothetical protein